MQEINENILMPDIKAPPCPVCGALNMHLEYKRRAIEYGKVDFVGQDFVCMGEIYDDDECKFHHIHCKQCDRYFNSELEFQEACKTAWKQAATGKGLKWWQKLYDAQKLIMKIQKT